MKRLLSGNEAVALGAREAGVLLATAYPGTPSTEILEALAREGRVPVQWAPNEKVAYEVAYGVSVGGGRALVAMKHVGVNVAADPLFSSVYAGVNGGLVLVSADDPGMHSSQNEQDNRHFARAAKLPLLEPADASEARDFTRLAFRLSEEFDTPVLLRLTTRVCHAMAPVDVDPDGGDPVRVRPWEADPTRRVLVPAHARRRHDRLEERLPRIEERACGLRPVNRIEWADRTLGVVTSGVAYTYVKEVLPHASVLKLGLSHPLPRRLVRDFAAGVDELYVVEELDPVLEQEIRALGLRPAGKEMLPRTGELDPGILARAFGVDEGPPRGRNGAGRLPPRPPVLCAGCGHRGAFYVLARIGAIVAGDIGCYSLGALPPLAGMDTCLCMGASVGMAQGLARARRAGGDDRPVVAVIGDSTFVHSGITGVVDLVYNRAPAVVLVLDNGTTAMTGHQPHPGTGVTASGETTHRLDIAEMCRAAGVRRVRDVDAYDLEALESVVREELAAGEPSVIISRAACRLVDRSPLGEPVRLTIECPGCGTCFELGCPALDSSEGIAEIDAAKCAGCGLCVQLCPFEGLAGGRDAADEDPAPAIPVVSGSGVP